MSASKKIKIQKNKHGMRSVDRLVLLLKEIAKSGTRGATLSNLVEATGLGYSAAHRILKCLVDQDLALKDSGTRRYFLGH